MKLIKAAKKRWEQIPLEVKVSAAYTISSILQRGISLVTFAIFARLLTQDEIGQYTLYSSWSGILSIFLTLNLAYGSFSTAMVKYSEDRDRYISSIEGICLLLTGGFLLLYLPLHRLFNEVFRLPTKLVVLMAAEILMQTAISLWSGKKRFEFKYKSVLALTLAVSVIGPLTAYFLVMHSQEKGVARIFGYALTTIAAGGALFILLAVRGKTLFHKEYWRYAFGFNIPLIIYYLSQVAFNQSDRIMIGYIKGEADAAMYGVAYNLAMVLSFVLTAVNNAYVPWVYNRIKAGEEEKNRIVSVGIAGLMGVLIQAVIWFAPELILLMGGPPYLGAVEVVPPVAGSLMLLFYAQLFINVQFYYEEKKNLVWASLVAATFNIVTNALFIPVFGFTAAGYTTLGSYVLFVAMNYLFMRKLLKRKGQKDRLYNYSLLLMVLAAFFAVGIIGMLLYQWLIPRVAVTVLVMSILFIFRKRIIAFVRLFKKNQNTEEPEKNAE